MLRILRIVGSMKYQYDKSSKKFICPNCNKKRFVRYVDLASNEYLDANFGKCDRETSCGYLQKPNNSIAKTLCNVAKTYANPVHESKLIHFHTKEVLQSTLKGYCNNNFYLHLLNHFSKGKVQNVFDLYKIGTAKNWNGATVFWQIDNQNNIRAGKIILFDLQSCKRVKHPYPCITWVHSKLKIEHFSLKQCLYGLHLIHSNKKIAIVESEKTAVIMALFMPEYTWLATGSKQNFKAELLEPIKNREIIVFPDKSEYNDWDKKSLELNKLGFHLTVSDYVEKMNCEVGTDLADLYLATQDKKETIELSKDEQLIKEYAKINPELFNLIKTFDLCDSFDNVFDLGRIK